MHRFSTEAYNKKPHQNSANLGNVKQNVYNTDKKTDDGVKLHGVVLAPCCSHEPKALSACQAMDGAGRWLQSDEVDGSLCATTTGQGLENHVNLVPNFCDYEFVFKKRPV